MYIQLLCTHLWRKKIATLQGPGRFPAFCWTRVTTQGPLVAVLWLIARWLGRFDHPRGPDLGSVLACAPGQASATDRPRQLRRRRLGVGGGRGRMTRVAACPREPVAPQAPGEAARKVGSKPAAAAQGSLVSTIITSSMRVKRRRGARAAGGAFLLSGGECGRCVGTGFCRRLAGPAAANTCICSGRNRFWARAVAGQIWVCFWPVEPCWHLCTYFQLGPAVVLSRIIYSL